MREQRRRYDYPRPRVRRRPGSKAGRIEQAILAEIEELRAASGNGLARTTVRFVYYRLIANGTIAKSEAGEKGGRRPDQDVSVVLSDLRWADVVGFDEIYDRTRGVVDLTGYDSVVEGVLDVIDNVRLDPWAGAAPLLIVESESLAGLVEATAYRYRVPLVPSRGQASDSVAFEVAKWVRAGHDRVLYVGDHDLSGPHIENALCERIEALYGDEIPWRRVALTAEQVAEHDLVVIQKWDGRTKSYHPAVETEALDQRILLPLIEEALAGLLPAELDGIEQDEKAQRKTVRQRLEAMDDSR
jgi:hypothetical protein